MSPTTSQASLPVSPPSLKASTMSPTSPTGPASILPSGKKAVSWSEPLCNPPPLYASLPHEVIQVLYNWRRERDDCSQRPEAIVVGFSIHRSAASQEELREWPGLSEISFGHTSELQSDGSTSLIGNEKAGVELDQQLNINEGEGEGEKWILKVRSIHDDPDGTETPHIQCVTFTPYAANGGNAFERIRALRKDIEGSTTSSDGQEKRSAEGASDMYSITSSHLKPSLDFLNEEQRRMISEARSLEFKAKLLEQRCKRRSEDENETLLHLRARDEQSVRAYKQESESLRDEVKKLRPTKKALQEVFVQQPFRS